MPTYTIGATGDYATLSIWDSARSGSAVSGVVERAELQSQNHTESHTFSTWPEGCDIEFGAVDPQDGDIHTGARALLSGFSRFTQMAVSGLNLTVEDITFNLSGQSANSSVINLPPTGNPTLAPWSLTVRRCIANGSLEVGLNANFLYAATDAFPGSGVLTIENSVISNIGAFYISTYGATDTYMDITARGCTLSKSSTRMTSYSTGERIQNISIEGCILDCSYNNDNSVESVIEDCVTTSGSSTISSQFATVTNVEYDVSFVDGTPASGQVGFSSITGIDFSLVDDANNVAIEHVTNGTLSTDILGNARGSVADAGAYELVASFVGTPEPVARIFYSIQLQ
jgi:hypothetical protein